MPASTPLHHLIIAVSDRDAAAAYFVDLLGLQPPWRNGFFQSVQLDDQVVVNFADRLYFREPANHMLERPT